MRPLRVQDAVPFEQTAKAVCLAGMNQQRYWWALGDARLQTEPGRLSHLDMFFHGGRAILHPDQLFDEAGGVRGHSVPRFRALDPAVPSPWFPAFDEDGHTGFSICDDATRLALTTVEVRMERRFGRNELWTTLQCFDLAEQRPSWTWGPGPGGINQVPQHSDDGTLVFLTLSPRFDRPASIRIFDAETGSMLHRIIDTDVIRAIGRPDEGAILLSAGTRALSRDNRRLLLELLYGDDSFTAGVLDLATGRITELPLPDGGAPFPARDPIDNSHHPRVLGWSDENEVLITWRTGRKRILASYDVLDGTHTPLVVFQSTREEGTLDILVASLPYGAWRQTLDQPAVGRKSPA